MDILSGFIEFTGQERGDTWNGKAMQNTDDYRKLQSRLSGNDTARKNTLRALHSGCTDEITEHLKELTAERKILLDKLAQCENGIEGITAENCKDMCINLKKYLYHSDDPDVKRYFREVLHEVIVSNDGVTVTMNVK